MRPRVRASVDPRSYATFRRLPLVIARAFSSTAPLLLLTPAAQCGVVLVVCQDYHSLLPHQRWSSGFYRRAGIAPSNDSGHYITATCICCMLSRWHFLCAPRTPRSAVFLSSSRAPSLLRHHCYCSRLLLSAALCLSCAKIITYCHILCRPVCIAETREHTHGDARVRTCRQPPLKECADLHLSPSTLLDRRRYTRWNFER